MENPERSSICRSCMETLSTFKYDLLESTKLSLLYIKLSSTQLSKDDPLPKFICNSCHQRLSDFDSFQRTCIESYKVLSDRFSLHNIKEEIYVKEELDIKHDNDDADEEDVKAESDDGSDYDPLKDDIKSEGVSSSEEESDSATKKERQKLKRSKQDHKEQGAQNKQDSKRPGFPFTCEICSRYFFKELRYEAHVRKVHRGLKPFACKLCNKEYRMQKQFSSHMKSEHSENPMKYPCTVDGCDKVYKLKESFQQHMDTHFKGKKLKVKSVKRKCVCETCGKTLSSKASLKMHTILHTNEYSIECDICHMKFRTESVLNEHKIKKHDCDSKYVCSICNLKKGSSYALKIHMTIHFEDKPHQCSKCPKAFRTKACLREHIRAIHERIKRHSCPHCAKRFVLPRHLTLHIRRHTGEQPHVCAVCDLQFSQKELYEEHTKRHRVGGNDTEKVIR